MIEELTRLTALSPQGSAARINALVRRTCGRVLSLPPLAAETGVDGPQSEAEEAVVGFAEQFSMDVAGISDDQRQRLTAALRREAFGVVVLMYIADFVPRVLAGLDALGLGDALPAGKVVWDHTTDPTDAVFNGFMPAVARQTALDPVTAEIVRLRGAAQHNCRLCNSRREVTALEAGGSEEMYGEISFYETSDRLSEPQKVALRYVDALIWSPADIPPDVAKEMRTRFAADEAVEVTFDVMRNAGNKIAVAMAADAPRVEYGTERYRILPDGQTQYE